jgi:membrane protein DedA with SNARE-associated domain
VVVLSSVGYSLGSEWSKLNHGLSVASYIVVAVVVVALIALVIHRVREFRREAAEAAERGETPADRVRR